MLKFYTDGSAIPNPGPGGWGFVVVDEQQKMLRQCGGRSLDSSSSSQRMELMAAVEVTKYLLENDLNKAMVFTDCQTVVTGINSWRFGWANRGWRKSTPGCIKNLDLWKTIHYNLLKIGPGVTWFKVAAHSGDTWNNLANNIARDYAQRFHEELEQQKQQQQPTQDPNNGKVEDVLVVSVSTMVPEERSAVPLISLSDWTRY